MDLFLNFKNKSYEARYFEDVDPYLSKVLKTCLVLIIVVIPFFPYSEYLLMQSLTESATTQIVAAVCASIVYFTLILCYIAVWKLKGVLRKHQNAARWALDILFALYGAYFIWYIWEFSKTQKEHLDSYLSGWFHALLIVTMLSPISKWYLKLAVILAVILRLGICTYITTQNSFEITKLAQMVILEILATYLSERDRRRYFIEKHVLYEETKVYKEIFESTSDAVIIYDLTKKLIFTNSSSKKHRWRNPEQSMQEDLERIMIKGYKKMSPITSNVIYVCISNLI